MDSFHVTEPLPSPSNFADQAASASPLGELRRLLPDTPWVQATFAVLILLGILLLVLRISGVRWRFTMSSGDTVEQPSLPPSARRDGGLPPAGPLLDGSVSTDKIASG